MTSRRATIHLEGQVDRITHADAVTHYTVAHLNTAKTHNRVTLTGIMPGIKTGETLRVVGSWETHPRFGPQFRVQSYTVTLPSTVEGIRHYLASGIVKGIGPSMAYRIVEHFGAQTLAVIEADSQKLQEVEGIGPAKAALIAGAWKEHHTLRELIRLLQDFGIQAGHAPAILQAYGSAAEDVLRSDPYRLVKDIPAIGFQAADAVSPRLGIAPNDPRRIRAAVHYLLQLAANEGHTYFPEDQLLARGEDLFQIDSGWMEPILKSMVTDGEVVVESAGRVAESPVVYLKALHQAESGIARRLEALLSVPVAGLAIDAERIAAEVHQKIAIRLSDEQVAALVQILAQRVFIITGGPGTGKTTLIRAVGAVFDALDQTCLLAAPTGRAARRLEEVAGREARTLHRLLGYNFSEDAFERNPDDPLPADAVVVDEASMVDVSLMFHLLQAVPMTSRLILVGDVFQLPPVGPGNVLADLIDSGRIQQITLTRIFRQDRESAIVRNAHRIQRGEAPDRLDLSEEGAPSEFYFREEGNPERAVDAIVDLCSRVLPSRFGLDPVRDIQVLTPMHRGMIGTLHLNQVLQAALNPNPVLIDRTGSRFKPRDKVMHLKNNYLKDVFNGDIGTITDVNRDDESLVVDFYGREVSYTFAELAELSLAYAISVHKSQGSEYPAVVIPIMTQHYIMLQRNLLYTAVTRAQQRVVLVGTAKALAIALHNDKPRRRLCGLMARLAGDASRSAGIAGF